MGDVIQFRPKERPRTFSEAALEQRAIAMVAEWHTLSSGIDALDTSPCEMNPEAS